jgi:hypothetical protein
MCDPNERFYNSSRSARFHYPFLKVRVRA